MLHQIFGDNWRTSLSAVISFIGFAAGYIIEHQAAFLALGFMSDEFKQGTISACTFIGFIGLLLFAYNAKDAANAGNTNNKMMFGEHRTHQTPGVVFFKWATVVVLLYIAVVVSFLMQHRLIG